MGGVRAHFSNTEREGIADFGPPATRYPAETIVWTPLDPLSVWLSVPSERRRLYIRRSAARLRRPGWVILGEGEAENSVINPQRDLLDDFRVAYRITDEPTYEVRSPTSCR